MTSLKDLKNRTNSIKSTRKITQAMKLISSVRYSKFNKQIKAADDYVNGLFDMLRKIYFADKQVFDESKNNFVSAKGRDGVLLVAFGSDKGLCGTFNVNVIKTIENQIKYYEQKKISCKIVCFGNKISQYLNKKYANLIIKELPIACNKKIYTDLHAVSSKLASDMFNVLLAGNYSDCDFIYSEHISMMQTNVVSRKILPLDEAAILECEEATVFSFDNSLQDILQQNIVHLFTACFHKGFLSSITAEYSSRMMAMDNATNNAKSLLVDLKKKYNRKRQAYITEELIEIISGAEAIN